MTADPFAAFERVRGEPVFHSPAHGGFWVVTRFADIRAVLRDTATFSSRYSAIPALDWPTRLIPVETDPPDHARYRALLTRYMAGGEVAAAVRSACAELAESLAPQGKCDLVEEFAWPIQSAMFAALFGLPQDQVEECARWAANMSPAVEPDLRKRAAGAIRDFLTDRLGDTTGLIGALVRNELSAAEIVNIGFVMVLGSAFTVTNAIGFSFRHLAERPELRKQLTPESCAVAAEELLRLHSVTNVVRTATRDTTLAGVDVKAGERVLLCLSLADRDPEVYPDPAVVRFDRPANPGHLAYGAGPHRCLGARIASQALTAALAEWHLRVPDYRIANGAVIRTGGGSVCTLDTLPLVWVPAPT